MKLVAKIALVLLVGGVLCAWAYEKVHADVEGVPISNESGVFGLPEIHEMRWEGLDRPIRQMHPSFVADSTAYTASPEETDSTPCHTADGTYICHWATEKTNNALMTAEYLEFDKICAVNGLPFGTVAWSEETGFCVFHDRMNARYAAKSRVDVLMRTKQEAREYGIKRQIPFYVIK